MYFMFGWAHHVSKEERPMSVWISVHEAHSLDIQIIEMYRWKQNMFPIKLEESPQTHINGDISNFHTVSNSKNFNLKAKIEFQLNSINICDIPIESDAKWIENEIPSVSNKIYFVWNS